MATAGRELDEPTRNTIFRLLRQGWSIRAVAAQARVSKTTVMKYRSRLEIRQRVEIDNWYDEKLR